MNILKYKYLKIYCLLFLNLTLYFDLNSQTTTLTKKNSFGLSQSFIDIGGSELNFTLVSNSINYTRYFNNLGLGLDLNRLQMKKDGLKPIGPTDDIFRRDNLHLYYSNILFNYRISNFCPLKQLIINIEIGPSILIGGKNKYYSLLEGNSDSLVKNSFWKNSERMEYETKFNLFGRFNIQYKLFEKFNIGLSISTYLKHIAPKFMGLPIPWGPNPRQINKSSFCSFSINYIF